MPQVQVIAPLRAQEPAKIKVCAYARVSSDSADQLNSFASQVRYYTNLISGNENWRTASPPCGNCGSSA